MANYLGRKEKGVKKIREKGNKNLGDMGPIQGTKGSTKQSSDNPT